LWGKPRRPSSQAHSQPATFGLQVIWRLFVGCALSTDLVSIRGPHQMRSSFALALGCAAAASAWPLLGIGEAVDLENLAPAHMLVASANNSTNITTASCGNATACNNNVTLSIHPLQVKSVETSLAGLAAILVALTYGLLTVYSPRLVTGLCIPREILSANIQEILCHIWPRTIDDYAIGRLTWYTWMTARTRESARMDN
jgi:hypothetical protein